MDGLRGADQVIPGPGLVRVGNACGIEHFLIINKAHRVLILGHAVELAVRAAGVGQRNVGEVLGVHNVGAVCQLAVVGVLQNLVGVHPEDIRHLVAHGGGFQLGPVFVPAGHLHLDLHIGMLGGVSVAHGLHAVALGHVPDLEGQVHGAVRAFAATGQPGGQPRGQADAQCGACQSAHQTHCLFPPVPVRLPPVSAARPAGCGQLESAAFAVVLKNWEPFCTMCTIYNLFPFWLCLLYDLMVER